MLDEEMRTKYLRQSHFSADVAWFGRVEDKHGFEEALSLADAVWRSLGKIQARRAREMLGLERSSLSALVAALELKFAAEEYRHHISDQQHGRIEIQIDVCPWVEILRKSNRAGLAEHIANTICPTVFSAWASEFSRDIVVSLPKRMCAGEEACSLLVEVHKAEEKTASEK